jgi:hypothetical protein
VEVAIVPHFPAVVRQLRYDLRKLKGHTLWNAMVPAMPTISPQEAFRSLRYSSSSTSASAVRWPTVVSTTNPIPHTAPTGSSKPPITKPTRRFRPSLTSSLHCSLTLPIKMLKYSCLRSSI